MSVESMNAKFEASGFGRGKAKASAGGITRGEITEKLGVASDASDTVMLAALDQKIAAKAARAAKAKASAAPAPARPASQPTPDDLYDAAFNPKPKALKPADEAAYAKAWPTK